jgi:hypothetical protein
MKNNWNQNEFVLLSKHTALPVAGETKTDYHSKKQRNVTLLGTGEGGKKIGGVKEPENLNTVQYNSSTNLFLQLSRVARKNFRLKLMKS